MLYNQDNTSGSNNSVGSTSTTPNLTPEQQSFLKAITGTYTGSIAPNIANVLAGSRNQFGQDLSGLNQAANSYNYGASQQANSLGTSGTNAINGSLQSLGNVGSNAYLQNQIQSALAPAQLQYQSNLANQTQDFSGAGQLGSARQAIANNALASTNMANQQQIAANVANNVANQQIDAQKAAGQIGLNTAQQSLSAYKQSADASSLPLDYYNKYANIIYGAANQTQPNFTGTQGSNVQSINQSAGITNNVKFGTGTGQGAGVGSELAGLAEGLKQYAGIDIKSLGQDAYDWLKSLFKKDGTPSQPTEPVDQPYG